MVRDSQDTDLFARDGVDEDIAKAPHQKASPAVTPDRAETGMLKQQADGVLKFSEQGQ